MRAHVVVHDFKAISPLLAIAEGLQSRGHNVVTLVGSQHRKRFNGRGLAAWAPAVSWWKHGLRTPWVASRQSIGRRRGEAINHPDIIVTDRLDRGVETLSQWTSAPVLSINTQVKGRAPTSSLDQHFQVHTVSAWLLGQDSGSAKGFCVPSIAPSALVPARIDRFLRAKSRLVAVCLPTDKNVTDIGSEIEVVLEGLGLTCVIAGQEWRTNAPDMRLFIEEGWIPEAIWPRFEAIIHFGQDDVVAQVAHAGLPSIGIRTGPTSDWINKLEEAGVARGVSDGPPAFKKRLQAELEEVLGHGELQLRATMLGLHVRAENGTAQVIAACETQTRKGSIDNPQGAKIR